MIYGPYRIKSNHFYCHITSAQVPWRVKFLRACSRQCKKNKIKTTIYIWTVHIYRLYRRQCAEYTYIYSVHTVYYKDILSYQCTNTHYIPYVHVCIMSTSMHSNMWRCNREYRSGLRTQPCSAGHIIRISSKSLFISLIPFNKWNLCNVYIHSTQTYIFQVFISFNFGNYNWQLMKTPNSVSQKIIILLKTNTKKGFLEILANWKVWTWKVWACTALNT